MRIARRMPDVYPGLRFVRLSDEERGRSRTEARKAGTEGQCIMQVMHLRVGSFKLEGLSEARSRLSRCFRNPE